MLSNHKWITLLSRLLRYKKVAPSRSRVEVAGAPAGWLQISAKIPESALEFSIYYLYHFKFSWQRHTDHAVQPKRLHDAFVFTELGESVDSYLVRPMRNHWDDSFSVCFFIASLSTSARNLGFTIMCEDKFVSNFYRIFLAEQHPPSPSIYLHWDCPHLRLYLVLLRILCLSSVFSHQTPTNPIPAAWLILHRRDHDKPFSTFSVGFVSGLVDIVV